MILVADRWDSYHALGLAVLEQAWRDASRAYPGAQLARSFLTIPSPLLKHWSHQAGLSYGWVLDHSHRTFGAPRED